MIPISKDQKIEKELNGIIYIFHPPTGQIEIDVMAINQESSQINMFYAKAKKAIDDSLKGNKHPEKKEYDKSILEKIQEYINTSDSSADFKERVSRFSRIIDIILCGWRSEKHKIPDFPKNGKPSDMMIMADKQYLFEWYLEQMQLTVDEVKN